MDFKTKLNTDLGSVRTLVREREREQATFSAAQTTRTWGVLSKIYDIGLYCLNEENAADYAAEFKARGWSAPDPTDNPWAGVLNLCTAVRFQQQDGTIKYRPNDSFKNHARAMRALYELGTKAGDAERAIKDFKIKDYAKDDLEAKLKGKEAKNLNGLKMLDLVRHPIEGKATDKQAVERVKKEPDLDLEYAPDDVKEYALVWCVVENGQLVPKGIVPRSEKKAEAAAIRAGLAILQQEADEANASEGQQDLAA